MPAMQRVVEIMNRAGELRQMEKATKEQIDALLGPGRSITDIAADLWTLSDEERNFMNSWPPALSEGGRAAMHNAALRGERIQLQWVPAYDFELRLWEPRAEGGSPGGLVVQFATPYPSDVYARLGTSGTRTSAARGKKKSVGRKPAARRKAVRRRAR